MVDSRMLRNKRVLPIGTVMLLTELTARQIRYYEAQGLVHPERTTGNHRLYALSDVDALLDIKIALESGSTLQEIKKQAATPETTSSDSEVRRLLRDELFLQGGFNSDAPLGFRFHNGMRREEENGTKENH